APGPAHQLPEAGVQLRGARALRVPIRARDRLLCDSFAMADQPRSLDRSRLGDGPLTTLSREELAELERALLGMLGIGLA
ncbi:MAG: type II toxin-antitoxin system PemK/MazF family toxin, partial [Cyanobium sp.]